MLSDAFARLAREGITSVLAEGGGGLVAALLRAGLVDELHWFVAPILLGADGRPALGPLGVSRLSAAPALDGARLRRLGSDWHLHARLRGASDGATW